MRVFSKATLFVLISAVFLCSAPLFAAEKNPNIVAEQSSTLMPETPKPPLIIPPAPAIDAASYILMDYNTGQILAEKDVHEKRAPASLTKLMTLYIIFNALENGQIHLDDKVRISKIAWKTGGSRMFINEGTLVPVQDLIQGVIVDSGNDATVALAEYLAGSQDAFVPLMNQQAQMLGMKDTHYDDVNGLPIKDHYSTAFDLALLTRATIHNFPDQYHWFKQQHFTWNKIKQTNRNWLLFRDPSVDGLKTGHTDQAGYCLIASAQRDGMRLVSVVLGAPSEMGRIDDTERLLNYGFRFYKTYKVYSANTAVTQARVWGGANKAVSLGLAEDLYLTIPQGQYDQLKLNVQLNDTLKAPIQQGQAYGTLTASLNDKVLAEQPLVALQSDAKGGIWTRLTDSVSLAFHHFFSAKDKKDAG